MDLTPSSYPLGCIDEFFTIGLISLISLAVFGPTWGCMMLSSVAGLPLRISKKTNLTVRQVSVIESNIFI
jgi:hypothetical protein